MGYDPEQVAKLFDDGTSDNEIKEFIARHANHPWPGLSTAGQTALTTRSMDRLAGAIRELKISSDRYSARIQWLTLALVILTGVLAIPVVKELLGWLKQ